MEQYFKLVIHIKNPSDIPLCCMPFAANGMDFTRLAQFG
jgi:hypothetical protein